MKPADSAERARLSRVQKRRKQHLVLFVIAFLLLTLVSVPAWPEDSLQVTRMENAGLALIILAILGRAFSVVYIGGRKFRELVVAGPYATVRNPLYVFSFLGALGIGLAQGSILLGIFAALAVYLVFDEVIKKEEESLRLSHGEAYENYLATVPRWVPNPFLWKEGLPKAIDFGTVFRTLRDGCLFLIALPLDYAVDYLGSAGLQPVILPLF